MRDARLALMTGSVSDAQRAVEAPMDLPPLPDHLRVVVLLERAFLASLSGDQETLRRSQTSSPPSAPSARRRWRQGLHDDLVGDRRTAAAHFATAAADVTFSQPATRALALTCEAQLARRPRRPGRAPSTACARPRWSRRYAATPCRSWAGAGRAPPRGCWPTSTTGRPDPWVHELAEATAGHPGIATIYAPTTATPREMLTSIQPVVRPTLSPREREVLNELARGATYADIAANLFVSENTIKTHVSSLYGKLSVSRRSEALAVARNLHLL